MIYQIIFTFLILLSLFSLSFSQNSGDYPIFIQYENRSLRGDGIERINQSYAQEIANIVFYEKVPAEFKDTLIFEGVHKVSQFYVFRWERYVNNIPIPKEGLVVDIDYSNGNVVLWSLNLGYPASQIDVTPALTKNMALYTIKKAYGVEPQSSGSYSPSLTIEGKRTVWSIYLPDNSIVTIDADTGETIRFSPTKEGGIYQQVPTKFNPTQYYLEVYGIYILTGLIIGGGIFLLKRKTLLFFKK